jgi:hypothetical protein
MQEYNRNISLVILSLALALVLIPTTMHDYQVKSKTVSINCSNDKPCQKTVCDSRKPCSTTIGETFESGTTSDRNSTTLGHQTDR